LLIKLLIKDLKALFYIIDDISISLFSCSGLVD